MTGIVAQNVGRTSGLIKAVSGGGAWTLIKTLTASANGTLDFVDGASDVILDSTYPIYRFSFISIHGSASSTELRFQASTDTGSSYGVATTTTAFMAEQGESDDPSLGYRTSEDHAQDTGTIKLSENFGNDNDQSGSGHMHLFNPSSTTFVKHFIAQIHSSHSGDYADHSFKAGYVNTTSAVDAIQFSMGSGNIDVGKIKLYGLRDS